MSCTGHARVVQFLYVFSKPDEDSIPVKKAYYDSLSNYSIFLDDLVCLENEANLISCERSPSAPLGVTDCTHLEDAGVRCNGMHYII